MTTREMIGREDKANTLAEGFRKAGITAANLRECPLDQEQWEEVCITLKIKRIPSDKAIARILEILDGEQPGMPPIVWADQEICPF